ncbi:MOSC domain-containing protein [Streptomyces tsukubensis]|uniref:MOSC domain-containing protein n=1 Tax=Streptomyces tsukubensis TaxID=83656 RepID=A0A1V3ZZG1_9ACTN|nr:MOSC N-terminal beta barrel domain-containing protein [Streptomyces tsukubensis]OON71386.1 MOSC domain-containing protein [Streptomyces tsukubensis]QFR97059.1 MOSC domain-containing protein [Streptomyces tsukubensis]
MPEHILRSIHVHPLKAARGHARREAVVEPWGLAGDRRWMLVDDKGTLVTQRSQPRLALLDAGRSEDGGLLLSSPGAEPLAVGVPDPVGTVTVRVFKDEVEAVLASEAAHAWCSAWLGAPVRLVHLDDPAVRRPLNPVYAKAGETVSFADGYPLLLTTTASLRELNSLIEKGDRPEEGPVPMDRFRPNVVIEGTRPWAEDDWAHVTIGDVAFRVVKPCGRCVVTTTDQRTGLRGKEPLRTLARHRRAPVGGPRFGVTLVPESRGTLHVGDRVTAVARIE